MKTNYFLTSATTIAAFIDELDTLGLDPAKYSVTKIEKVTKTDHEVTVSASANDLRRLRKILASGDAS